MGGAIERLRENRLAHAALQPAYHAALRLARWDLDRVARGFETDKSSQVHGYTQYYARHLPRRRDVKALLEIGVGGYSSSEGGHSIQMWGRYFDRANIIGIDVHDKQLTGPRISFERGSQDDPEFLAAVAERYGPFDVVIDDGSHIGRHVRASFSALLPHVKPGGWYVIEDLATAYHPDWEGGPPGTAGTQIELIKDLVDKVHDRHLPEAGPHQVDEVHVYNEIAFVRKGPGSGDPIADNPDLI